MITIYICAKCECPALAVYDRREGRMCIKCYNQNRRIDAPGSGMGEKLVRVIMPDNRQMEMSVTNGVAEVQVDGKKIEIESHSVLLGAKRKVRA